MIPEELRLKALSRALLCAEALQDGLKLLRKSSFEEQYPLIAKKLIAHAEVILDVLKRSSEDK